MKGLLTKKDVEQIKQFLLTEDASGWFHNILGGTYLQGFQAQFANFCKAKYAIACSSGSASLYLALRALDIPRQSSVLVPTYTHVGSVAPIVLAGAIPVFADCDEWGNIKIEEKHRAIGLAAIIAVHQLGMPCDVDSIRQICPNVPIIEDASHAMGSTYKEKPVGTLGDIACFSIGGGRTKTIGTGEGGMVITNNYELAERVVNMRNHGDRDCDAPYFCFNFRMSEINALIGYLEMQRVDALIEEQMLNAQYLIESLPSYLEVLPLPNYVTRHCRYIIQCYSAASMVKLGLSSETFRTYFLSRMKDFQKGPREYVGSGYTKLVSDISFYSHFANHQKYPQSKIQRDTALWIDYHRPPRTKAEIDILLKRMRNFD